MASYGWIMKAGDSKIRISKNRGTGTKTGEYFGYFFTKEAGVMKSEKIRSKNLYEKGDQFYYILSIGKGKSTWAPYPFITELENLTLILTQDSDEGKGNVWVIKKDGEKKKIESDQSYFFNGIELKKQSRDDAGDYYSLSLNQVKNIKKKNGEGQEPDFSFDNSKEGSRISDVVNRILGKHE